MIMEKTKNFDQAKENITYLDLRRMFNELNKQLRGEFYANSKDLKRPDGSKAIGFVYEGYVAGIGLRKILDIVGIKYSTNVKSGTGTNEKSEILIDVKDEKRMLDIFEKLGVLQSNIYTGINTQNLNIKAHPLAQTIR